MSLTIGNCDCGKVLRSWVQIPPGPFLPVLEIRYCFELDFNNCWTDSAADEIIKYAKEKAIDLIVVGTKGRSGMTKALLGSVASKVVTYSPCSVLVVR